MKLTYRRFDLRESFDYEQLPYSLEAEQSVLGSLLIDPGCISESFSYIPLASFYSERHQKIFSVFLKLFTSGLPIDFITVLNACMRDNIFDSEQSAKIYLTQLMDMVPSIANFVSYCKIVKEKFYLRSLIKAARNIIDLATKAELDAETILDLAEQQIFDIRQDRINSNLVPIDEVISQEFGHLDKLLSGEEQAGIPSGYSALDALITRLSPSDLIILAARPAMGKTSFALNIASRAAKQSKKQVIIFSLEMSSQQLVERMLASECSILSTKLHSGNIGPDEWPILAAGAQELGECQIFFDDTPNLGVAEMKAKLRRFSDLGLVIIDYLQLMSTGRRDANRVQEISEITRMLKIMAKELSVPVISLSQLARGPEARQDHRPILSDLRESGAIEQDADIVMFLYRDEYYNPETGQPGVAECIVAKNRHGETGAIELGWDGKFTRFIGLDRYHNE